jgi:hypothetical protein
MAKRFGHADRRLAPEAASVWLLDHLGHVGLGDLVKPLRAASDNS